MRYNPALDGLRAIAVLAVIEFHGHWHWLGLQGSLGVDMFFVLSGFLITSILLREEEAGGIRLGEFYLRRARRLYPALITLTALMLAAGWITWKSAGIVLLYLSDYIAPPDILGHTWTLAVEEHYYLLWPLLLPFVARMGRRNAVVLLALLYAAAFLWNIYQPFAYRFGFRFDMTLTGLLFGCLLAFLPRDTKLPFVALALASLYTIASGPGHARAFAEAATACLIVLSYQTTIPFLTRAPLVYIGRISYGIYLYHWPVQWLLRNTAEGWQQLLLVIVVSIACAALSYHTVEAYFRKPRPVSYSGTLLSEA